MITARIINEDFGSFGQVVELYHNNVSDVDVYEDIETGEYYMSCDIEIL